MERGMVIFVVLLAIIVVGGYSAYFVFFSPASAPQISGPAIPINYTNFEAQVQQQPLVHALPSSAAILLQFYNFDSGARVIEQSYLLTQDKVEKGTLDAPDITIFLHSQYLSQLTNQNFCAIIAQAKSKGDMSVDTTLSKSALAWKYRSMVKYKECLGF